MIPALIVSLTLISGHAEAAPSPEMIGETLWLAREASEMASTTPATAALRMPRLLKAHFNVSVTCGKGQLFDPSSPRCLLGTRRVARAFYRGVLRALDPAVAEVVLVNITDEARPRISTTEVNVRVNLPYGTTTEDAARLITEAIGTKATSDRIAKLAEYQKALAAWNDLELIDLDFDPRLSLGEKRRALDTLLELAERDPDLFERPSEVLYVTRGFHPLFERRLRLQEAFRYDANFEDARQFLTSAKVETTALRATAARVEGLRERIRVVGERLERELNVKYDCTDESDLSLFGCANTLERFARWLDRAGKVEADVKMVLVAGEYDLPADVQVFEAGEGNERYKVLGLRQGFETGKLRHLARDRGWVP